MHQVWGRLQFSITLRFPLRRGHPTLLPSYCVWPRSTTTLTTCVASRPEAHLGLIPFSLFLLTRSALPISKSRFYAVLRSVKASRRTILWNRCLRFKSGSHCKAPYQTKSFDTAQPPTSWDSKISTYRGSYAGHLIQPACRERMPVTLRLVQS